MKRSALMLVAALFLSISHSADNHLVAAQRVGGYFVGPPARPPVFMNERLIQYQDHINAHMLYPRGEFVPRAQLKRRSPQNPALSYPNYY